MLTETGIVQTRPYFEGEKKLVWGEMFIPLLGMVLLVF